MKSVSEANSRLLKIYQNKDSYGLSTKNEKMLTRSPNIKLILFLIIFIVCFGLILYIRKESKETTNATQIEKIRFSALSPNVVAEAEVELNKRLHESNIKSFFYRARIQGDAIYVFLDREVWRDLSLGEKSDVLTEIVQVCKNVPEEVSGIPIELIHQKPQIYIYDRDFKRELALWTREGAAIIN
jgi:hypothetical protein